MYYFLEIFYVSQPNFVSLQEMIPSCVIMSMLQQGLPVMFKQLYNVFSWQHLIQTDHR